MSEPKPSPTTASVESLGADAGTSAILAWPGVEVNSPNALISNRSVDVRMPTSFEVARERSLPGPVGWR
jgi:hypothetical protein